VTEAEQIAALEAQVATLRLALNQVRLPTAKESLVKYEEMRASNPRLTLRAFADTTGISYEALKKAQQRNGTTHRGRPAKRRLSVKLS
jgi:hypothetical protein